MFPALSYFPISSSCLKAVGATKSEIPVNNLPPNPRAEIIGRSDLRRIRDALDQTGGGLVLTNGCFDILHEGHRLYLAEAAGLARSVNGKLAVAINSDRSVRALKGPDRPVRTESHRARLLAEVEGVDFVTIFDEDHVTDLLLAVRPHFYVKGGDYTIDTIEQGLRRALEEAGIAVKFLALKPGVSTTTILNSLDSISRSAIATSDLPQPPLP